MAYTDPKTMGAEPGVSADWNTYVRDNIRFLFSPPVCKVATGAAQSITNNTTTKAAFDAEGFKRDLTHSTSVANTKVTVATTGIYTIHAQNDWDANSTGRRYMAVLLNNTTAIKVQNLTNPSATHSTSNGLSFAHALTAGDYIEIQLYQDSGGSLNAYPNMQIVWHSGP